MVFTVVSEATLEWYQPRSTGKYCYFSAFELVLMRLPLGREFTGPVSPEGNVPKYVDNAFASYIITLVTFVAGVEMDGGKAQY